MIPELAVVRLRFNCLGLPADKTREAELGRAALLGGSYVMEFEKILVPLFFPGKAGRKDSESIDEVACHIRVAVTTRHG